LKPKSKIKLFVWQTQFSCRKQSKLSLVFFRLIESAFKAPSLSIINTPKRHAFILHTLDRLLLLLRRFCEIAHHKKKETINFNMHSFKLLFTVTTKLLKKYRGRLFYIYLCSFLIYASGVCVLVVLLLM
jgi:hypothetical protein